MTTEWLLVFVLAAVPPVSECGKPAVVPMIAPPVEIEIIQGTGVIGRIPSKERCLWLAGKIDQGFPGAVTLCLPKEP